MVGHNQPSIMGGTGQRKVAYIPASNKQSEKGGAREEESPFQVTPPVTHLSPGLTNQP